MKNRYLEKISQEQDEAGVSYKALGAGALAGKASVPRLLGYHKVYHGTSSETAKKILKEGFDPSKGGSGAAKGHSRYESQSAGKIHVTKNPLIARMFAAFTDRGAPLTDGSQMQKAIVDSLKLRGGVVSARIPQSYWEGMKPDPDMGGVKPAAATFHHKIEPKYVDRAVGVKNILPHLSPKHLSKYYKNHAGRALTGLGLAAGGSALIASQVPKIKAKINND